MIKTVAQGWESFNEQVLQQSYHGMPEELIKVCKRCFYAGAAVFVAACASADGPDEIEALSGELSDTLEGFSNVPKGGFDA